MNFDAFWEIVKWIVPLGVAGLFWLVWHLNDGLREDFKEHEKADDSRHKEVTNEMSALRQQVSAFQLEVVKNYATVADVSDVESGLRRDIVEIKQDVKEMLKMLGGMGGRRT